MEAVETADIGEESDMAKVVKAFYRYMASTTYSEMASPRIRQRVCSTR